MRLNEIERIPSSDYEGGKQNLKYTAVKNVKLLPGGSGLQYSVDKYGYGMTIMIVDPEINVKISSQVVGKLTLSKQDFILPNTYSVGAITVDEDYRGRGLAKALYGIAISMLHINLVSGDSQTPGGRRNWVSLANIPGCEVVGLASLYDHRLIDTDIDVLMSLGCVYLGAKSKEHWFYFPVKRTKQELVTTINSKLKLYHSSEYAFRDISSFLLARWIG